MSKAKTTKTTSTRSAQTEARKALKQAWRASMRAEHGADWFTKFSSEERERMRCAATGAPTRAEAKAKAKKAPKAPASVKAGAKKGRAKAAKRMTKAELIEEIQRLRGNAGHTAAGKAHAKPQYDDAGAMKAICAGEADLAKAMATAQDAHLTPASDADAEVVATVMQNVC